MGLNDAYDSIKGKLLLMEPLQSANKAYSMVLRVEKQREVNQTYVGIQENSAFFAKTHQTNYDKGRGNQNRGRGTQGLNNSKGEGRGNDKAGRFYDYCNTPGHTRDTCFLLVGYPEWYQQLKGQKENINLVKHETIKTPFDHSEEPTAKQDFMTSMLQGLQQELDKIKGKLQNDSHAVNMAHNREFASNISDTPQLEYAGTSTTFHITNTALHTSLNVLENIRPGS